MMMKTRVALAAACLALAAAQPASAHGPVATTAKAETALRSLEERLLGTRHATEHAAQRRLARSSRPRRERVRARASADGPASEIGRWTTPPFSLPGAFAIHAALLPTGKVLYYGFPLYTHVPDQGYPREGEAYLWDPANDSFEKVTPPLDPANRNRPGQVFCSGQSFLPDGRLVVTGGTILHSQDSGGQWTGLKKTWIFDSWREEWVDQKDMAQGRWYPSQVLLPDGRTLIMGGVTERGGANRDMEVFPEAGADPVTGRIDVVGSRGTELYPHLFTMPDGKVLLGGPGPADSALLNPFTWSWQNLPPSSRGRTGGTAVLRPGGPAGSTKVTQIGGYDTSRTPQATNTTITMDTADTAKGWQPDLPLNLARRHHNTVVLPDGSMVTVGGDTEAGLVGNNPKERQVELLAPGATAWRLGPAQAENRAYHSTALLLPDGRVFSGGDDLPAQDTTKDTGEIYSPPYLFQGGERPTIAAAPSAVRWGATFGVQTPDADVTKAVLVAPAAVTHATDMSQRLVPLSLARTAGGVNLTAPPNANVAPPGYYMLFLLDDRGVPSVATWVRVHGDAPATGPLTAPAPNPESTPPTGEPESAATTTPATDTPAAPVAAPTPTPRVAPTPTPAPAPAPRSTPTPTPVGSPATRTTTLTPTADARTTRSARRTNHARSALRVGTGTESHLRFTVPALSGQVTSARLRVYATTATRNGPALYGTATTWTETRLTWSTRPRRISGVLGDKRAIRARTWVEYDLTRRLTRAGAYAFVLAPTSADAVDFASRERTTKPQLIITTR